jgi:hypothetical protein
MLAIEREMDREAFLARLTTTAYRVALRHGIKGSFAAVELDMWRELREACEGINLVEVTEDGAAWQR